MSLRFAQPPARQRRRGTTPVTAATAFPSVVNTGVPLGLSVPTSAFGYYGEGLTDTRPTETLTAASGTTVPGWTAPDANGLAYLPNVASDLTYDHVDFTNVKLIVPAAVLSVTFTKCRFRCTSTAMQANWAQGSVINLNGAGTALTFSDCTLEGALPDPNWAVQHFLSAGSSNTSAGITFQRCNVSGFSTLLDVGSWSHGLFDSNYCHDAVINKYGDQASGYTNSGLWAHIDGFQIGACNNVGDVTVQNNTFIAFSATNQIASGPLQVGQMTQFAGGNARIDKFVFDNNLLDGGAYICGANLNTPITVSTYFKFTNNKIGRHYAYGVDGANSIHSLTAQAGGVWSGNTYYESGIAGNVGGLGSVGSGYQVAVTAGQAIP